MTNEKVNVLVASHRSDLSLDVITLVGLEADVPDNPPDAIGSILPCPCKLRVDIVRVALTN